MLPLTLNILFPSFTVLCLFLVNVTINEGIQIITHKNVIDMIWFLWSLCYCWSNLCVFAQKRILGRFKVDLWKCHWPGVPKHFISRPTYTSISGPKTIFLNGNMGKTHFWKGQFIFYLLFYNGIKGNCNTKTHYMHYIKIFVIVFVSFITTAKWLCQATLSHRVTHKSNPQFENPWHRLLSK